MSGLTQYDTGMSFICLMGRALLERGFSEGNRYHRGCGSWIGRPHEDCVGIVVRTSCSCACHAALHASAGATEASE